MTEFIAGLFVGAVGMALGVVYEAWRARPEVEPEPTALPWWADGAQILWVSVEVAGTTGTGGLTDEWADEEARALEAAEAILREQAP
jgi:hypothetical protein